MKNKSALTLRGIIIGILGLLLITASSLYVALKMGALPWPAVFVTVLSMTALRKAKGATLEEVNTTHTLMSAGSMVAGGLAFTIPGIWMIDSSAPISLLSVMTAVITGAVLGTLFTTLYRKTLIEEQKLPYPIGEAAYRTLITWKDTKSAPWLFSAMGGSAVFTFLRDSFHKIPMLLTPFKGTALFPSLSIYISPMALSIGAIIGPSLAIFWTLGMIVGYYILTPIGLSSGLFDSMASADSFRSSMGLGIMIGTGFAVAVKAIWHIAKNKSNKKQEKGSLNKNILLSVILICFASIIILSLLTDMSFIESILTLIGIAIVTYLSSMLTGQTGINPMEVFAILVLLAVQALCHTGLTAAFTLAAAVAVSCGLSGDVMNDFKSGSLVGTSPKDQIRAEAIGGILGAIVATLILFLMKKTFTFGSVEMPAPQANAVRSMVNGLDNPIAFWVGVLIGFVMFFLSLPSSAFGLGMYLGTYITTTVALGALVMFIIKKCLKEKEGGKADLISAGLLGGEGVAGVISAFITMFSI